MPGGQGQKKEGGQQVEVRTEGRGVGLRAAKRSKEGERGKIKVVKNKKNFQMKQNLSY
jgi:hypothetical protein